MTTERTTDTAGLFVRIPVSEAEKLDRAAFELKTPKQDLVAGLLARYVDPASPQALAKLGELGGRRKVTVETVADDALVVGQHSFRPADEPDVMTLDEVAEWLQVDEEAVEVLATKGDLPGRRIGDEWRFARQAILDWLAAERGKS
jgi:excisionase family DNA binding protein